ncbi:MAG: EutN/CcmL family microcompartment protein, partial [Phycisphaerae bacterium]
CGTGFQPVFSPVRNRCHIQSTTCGGPLMILAKVLGTVVSSQKESSMDGLRFMLIQPVDSEGKPSGAHVVAVDAVGSGPGEYVLYAAGSSARQTLVTDKRPCDAVIMAIVDNWEIDGDVKYHKGDAERR